MYRTLSLTLLAFLGAGLCGMGTARAEVSPQSGQLLRNLGPSDPQQPGLQCRQAIRAAEIGGNIPSQLMAAIGRIESGRPDAQGVVQPWPWTINAEGEDHYYASKAEAIAAVRVIQARGVRSVDVGCMQVNLMYHPDAFASLDQAFDPSANAVYAARFLNQLYVQTGDWAKATAAYHSSTLDIGADYERKVANVLPEEQRRLADMPSIPPANSLPANVWSNNVWSANMWNTHGPTWPSQTGLLTSSTRPALAPSGKVSRAPANFRMAPIPVLDRQIVAVLPQGRGATR